ncbi:MAG TPA: hypothetical protein PLZ32_09880 [Saprospiraceae bacterium]|nr:hypothetical protein [Saprospiraceae bacterium]
MSIFKSQLYKILCVLTITINMVNPAYNQESISNGNTAQEKESINEPSDLKNELKLNLAFLPLGVVEGTYERLLSKNTSLGVVYGKSITEEFGLRSHAMLLCRLFFGKKPGSGFFIEAHGSYLNLYSDFNEEKYVSKGLGFAVGGKFFRGNRFHGEVLLGIGRIVENYGYYYYEIGEIYPRFAISLGHRF